MRARLLTLVLATLLALGVAEIGLRVLERATDDRALDFRRAADPILGSRIPPHAFHHDANGFRNEAVPARADVVVMGDSQSWGMNVRRAGSWPAQLAALSGQSVYNMSMVGFGPAQYWALTPQALTLQPSTVIVQLFLGNDFRDAFAATYTLDHYRSFRAIDETFHGGAIAAVDAANRIPGEWDLVEAGWWMRSSVVRFASRWTADRRIFAHAVSNGNPVFDDSHTQAVIATTSQRVRLDQTDPAIAEGARLTLAYLTAIRAQMGATRLVVMLIPAKALVYAPFMTDAKVHEVARLAEQAAARVQSWCVASSVTCVHPLAEFREAVSQHQPLYPRSLDAHPNQAGYRLVAEAVRAAVLTESGR